MRSQADGAVAHLLQFSNEGEGVWKASESRALKAYARHWTDLLRRLLWDLTRLFAFIDSFSICA
jgi:hypothetical protein